MDLGRNSNFFIQNDKRTIYLERTELITVSPGLTSQWCSRLLLSLFVVIYAPRNYYVTVLWFTLLIADEFILTFSIWRLELFYNSVISTTMSTPLPSSLTWKIKRIRKRYRVGSFMEFVFILCGYYKESEIGETCSTQKGWIRNKCSCTFFSFKTWHRLNSEDTIKVNLGEIGSRRTK